MPVSERASPLKKRDSKESLFNYLQNGWNVELRIRVCVTELHNQSLLLRLI